MKLILTLGLLITTLTHVIAQPEYARNSLTLMAVDFNGKHSNTLIAQFPALMPPEKFYNNPLQNCNLLCRSAKAG
ncbi:MAG: hypothetical protein IPO65_18430 [Saprospiraceae bacterium]|nr:hypothetical protein [Saprospiraceae bacterium]